MTPVRIQRRRTKGWKMPPNTVTVARPSRFGNPFSIAGVGPTDNGEPPRETAVRRFRGWLSGEPHPYGLKPPSISLIVSELRGKNLACWCRLSDQPGKYVPCHADVLLSIANDVPLEEVIRESTGRAKGAAAR